MDSRPTFFGMDEGQLVKYTVDKPSAARAKPGNRGFVEKYGFAPFASSEYKKVVTFFGQDRGTVSSVAISRGDVPPVVPTRSAEKFVEKYFMPLCSTTNQDAPELITFYGLKNGQLCKLVYDSPAIQPANEFGSGSFIERYNFTPFCCEQQANGCFKFYGLRYGVIRSATIHGTHQSACMRHA